MVSTHILGISCYYHDAAACLIRDGKIIAAMEEEKFTRIKHDNNFPINSITHCLKKAGINAKNLDFIGFYEKPVIKFERVIQTFTECYPSGFWMFYKQMPSWINEKLRIKSIIKNRLKYNKDVLFIDHHTSHASSAFFVSPFKKATIITIDGVGEWITTSIKKGIHNNIFPLQELHFPHSLGLLYSTITSYLGFNVNNDEYKVMGLAAQGKPKYHAKFRKIINIKNDGSFKMDMKYFDYSIKTQMWAKELENLMGKPRKPYTEITKRHENIAATLQKITEEIYFKIANHAYELTKFKNLCIAGGVGLNSVANGKLYDETPFEKIFVQPAATDAGGAIGTAYFIWNQILKRSRKFKMYNAYLGPEFNQKEIKIFLDNNKIKYKKLSKKELPETVAKLLSKNKIIGWFQGKTEWGPRALGNRSILANPINPDMKNIINSKIKHREDFRPFAGSVLKEDANHYFKIPENNHNSPFMNFVFKVLPNKEKFIPSITHTDKTCRIQTVSKNQNAMYYSLIKKFKKLTGIPIILNTSFNLKDEPIVCTPQDALNDFYKVPMDCLIMGSYLIEK